MPLSCSWKSKLEKSGAYHGYVLHRSLKNMAADVISCGGWEAGWPVWGKRGQNLQIAACGCIYAKVFASMVLTVRLGQKERTQMQNGRNNLRSYFTLLQLFWQNDKPMCYEILWKTDKTKHRRNKDAPKGGNVRLGTKRGLRCGLSRSIIKVYFSVLQLFRRDDK